MEDEFNVAVKRRILSEKAAPTGESDTNGPPLLLTHIPVDHSSDKSSSIELKVEPLAPESSVPLVIQSTATLRQDLFREVKRPGKSMFSFCCFY